MDFIPVNRPLLSPLEKKYVLEALDSGWISSDGPFVEEFEKKFSKRVNRKYGIAVSNGSAALDIAVKALGISTGQEVIMPTFTIISCALAVIRNGAKPIFVDCYEDTWNMKIEEIESKITPRTVAIMPVHIYGLPVDMNPLIKIAEKYNLAIIEDAAEAHGQTYFGKPCGSFGKLSTFSFYANKHLTTGEGGMIVTDDFELAEKCKKLRNLCFEPEKRFIHYDIGWNYRLTNLQAALGLAQLENLDKSITRKRLLGQKYQDLLSNIQSIQTPVRQKDGYENHYWIFGLVLKPELKKSAKMIMESLNSEGIGTRPFFWPMHKQPILSEFVDTSFSVSERISEFGFYLPSGVGTTDDEIEIVVSKLKKVLS
jgi:perosamine synthetase